ncbi:pyrroloquinoline quinone biosynthesis protein PqqE [Siccirubricoccus sp. KC 17139]|uniref:PqqA peptide cyclase n=1 Tax=Siccirubricoccus soli TaxID=2899147 RepID=A0ABT1D3F6_9PROT|nr:pyrroloquinoline quinone biosynthesis protein PqqE [Siccirubricoccus soli]MCO6416419.1 pyrroloquinoline quinone biosynthesis protein PqqE [Siccirubricoccus soli]MCP2682553.1 pyrroloquinoline quinone biosynthesis protein PqqE [Siccirubricoccus soli]
MIPAPLALLAELTHRCPLRCPYCSNPVALTGPGAELDTATWARVFEEAAALGCLQVHLSGGEPMARRDIAALVAAASGAGLYTNLITAGVLLDAAKLAALAAAGLDHVQLSVQDAEAGSADRIGGCAGGHARKLAAARLVTAAGLPLTLNAVVHRQNLDRLPALIELALALGAQRLEVAHVQYYGWALANRAALLPSRAQLEAATATVESARAALKGRLVIDYVVPDYHAKRPKPCMGGWGRRFLAVSPAGLVLPCHAAESLPGFGFPDVRRTSLRAAWERSEAFNRFRGTGWMAPPCRGCARAEIDWGGCRCQAFALAGDAAAADPACALSPHHALLGAAVAEAAGAAEGFTYREPGRLPLPKAPAAPFSATKVKG